MCVCMCYTPKISHPRSECVTATICSLFVALPPLRQSPRAERSRRVAHLVRVVMNEQPFLLTHKPTQTSKPLITDVINEIIGGALSAAAFLCTTGWHCSSSLHHSLPPSVHSFSLSPFPCVSSFCVGGRLESPESTTRITRSILETISFSHLFYMVYPSISLSSLPLSLSRSLWLICVFTLCPSSHSLLLGI